MGRPSGAKAHRRQLASTLRIELERQIERGRCAYCGAPASPNEPLTREHVIPRARGGRRKDVRIIVPACARCNHRRGCRELIPFLLARPQRISSFIDYLTTLSPTSIQAIDLRILAELYAAVAILHESASHGPEWRAQLARLCSGRSLHRRRYAARRALGSLSERMERMREEEAAGQGPSCPLPAERTIGSSLRLDEPLELIAARLLGILALLWQVSAEVVKREMSRELTGTAVGGEPLVDSSTAGSEECGAESLDGWKPRPKRKRMRVDRRRGRPAQKHQGAVPMRGRAA